MDCKGSGGDERKPVGWSHFLTCFQEVDLPLCACSGGPRVVPSALAVTTLIRLRDVDPRLPDPEWDPTRQRPTRMMKGWHSVERMGVGRRAATVPLQLSRQRRHWHAGCSGH